MKTQEYLTHEVETAKIQASNQLASNLVCSEKDKWGVKAICANCFDPNVHRHTGIYTKKGCQALLELKSI